MLRINAFFLTLAFLAVPAIPASSQAPEKPRPDFLAAMKVGQAVTLKDVAGRYEITKIENGPAMLSHKITEVGSDYVVVVDLAGVTETRIPIYSIKSFVRLKILKK